MDVSALSEYIKPDRRAHLIGIGGVSMSPLAEVLLSLGVKVTGSDISESESVLRLRAMGIDIKIGHAAENIAGADFIIRTAAAHDDNPEIVRAHETNIPVFERAQAWGYIMRSYKNAICISGTHGKTTTTSMVTHILMAAEADPTVMIGGTLPLLGAAHRVGKGDCIVMESCEYYDSFLSFSPTVAVILNVEADHLDYFKDLADVQKSFRNFASLVPETGSIVCWGDDESTMAPMRELGRELITFGLGENCVYTARDIAVTDGRTEFTVYKRGEKLVDISLGVPGMHNVKNALAAVAATDCLGISPDAARAGLMSFSGAKRRFQYKGRCSGADVYDDYAHHPGELAALIDAARSLNKYERVIIAFQPHTYTRTNALFDDFVAQLKRPDKVYLAEIYAAREKNTIGISSRDLADKVESAVFCENFDILAEKLKEEARVGDLILTVGAGNICDICDMITDK